ncbi:MAG: hypothetical protein LBE18_09780 [Planctomycetaceae bacterium]|jgi:hypothetical protein|nr:hypothetical protein [Planctomycetaceae bacterium]
MSYNIPQDQIQELQTQYCKNRGHRFSDRIRVVIALARGYKVSDLALIFMLDCELRYDSSLFSLV